MAKATILVVDDDEDIRLAVQALLESRDYKVFKDSKAIRAISDLWAKLVRRVKGD